MIDHSPTIAPTITPTITPTHNPNKIEITKPKVVPAPKG
jgi:hypothetical protein